MQRGVWHLVKNFEEHQNAPNVRKSITKRKRGGAAEKQKLVGGQPWTWTMCSEGSDVYEISAKGTDSYL